MRRGRSGLSMWGWRSLSMRRFAGSLVALLILVQSLAAALPAHAYSRSAAGAVALASGAPCSADAPGGDKLPERKHSACIQCCILCGGRGCDVSSPYVAPQIADEILSDDSASSSIDWRSLRNILHRPIARANATLSRGPPSLS